MVDFGLTTCYNDEKGNHIEEGIPDKFKGSMLFASKNAFKFEMTSRRDDLIALCYLLIYLIDENQLGFIAQVEGMSKKEKFLFIKSKKLNLKT